MRRGDHGFTLIEIMVVIAIIAGLVAAVSLGIPIVQERSRRLTCATNLSDLGKIYVTWKTENPNKPPYSGAALFLHWRKKREIPRDKESVLICPGDQQVLSPDTDEIKDRYDNVDLTNPPNDLCSYAGRDFDTPPWKVDAGELQIIACDRQGTDGKTAHHKDGLNILYDDGSAKFMDREKLGLTNDAQIVVGPESENAKLKMVIYSKEKKE
jgi:prepilin-type N-terminal cleavage/methylation domain-containing protein